MTILRLPSLFLGVLLMGMALQGCAGAPGSAGAAGERLFAADMTGQAKTCEAAKTAPSAGKVVETTMKVSSDGGWCGLSVRNGGQPYEAGLLKARPAHGKLLVHRVGGDTRMDYTPNFGFSGADSFTVDLLPGEAGVKVAVTVAPK